MANERVWSWQRRGCGPGKGEGVVLANERVYLSKGGSWFQQRVGCCFGICEGMVLADERSGPGR